MSDIASSAGRNNYVMTSQPAAAGVGAAAVSVISDEIPSYQAMLLR